MTVFFTVAKMQNNDNLAVTHAHVTCTKILLDLPGSAGLY